MFETEEVFIKVECSNVDNFILANIFNLPEKYP